MPDDLKPDNTFDPDPDGDIPGVVGNGIADLPVDRQADATMSARTDRPEAIGEPKEEEFPDLSSVMADEAVARPAEFQQLSPLPGASEAKNNIDLLLDVKMPVAIELGRTELSIAELLNLGPGSVVELNKLAGEPVDVLVNNKIIARGEVVVVDESFGVRVTQLLSPQERLQSLAQE